MSFFVRDRSFYRSLIALSVPLSLQNLITFGITMADNMMVGRLGETSIGALYVGVVCQLVLANFTFGIANSVLILAAQYWGRRDTPAIRDIASIALRLSFGIGLVFTALAEFAPRFVVSMITDKPEIIDVGVTYVRTVGISYLLFALSQTLLTTMRSVEIVKIGLVDAVMALVLNVGLNYILIFGAGPIPQLGVRGAAFATDLARLAEFALVYWYVFRHDRSLGMRLPHLKRWNSVLWRDLVKYGTPLMAGQIVWAINMFMRGRFIGHMQPESIAVAAIADMINGFVWMGPLGLAIASGILVGKTIGRDDYVRVKEMARTLQVMYFGIGAFLGLAVWFTRDFVLSFYTLTDATLAAAVPFFAVQAIMEAGRCYQAPSLMGLVKAGGDTAFVFKNDSFWVFCWILPATYIAQSVIGAPDWVVYTVLLSDQVTKAFVAVVKVNRFRWMKNLVRR